MRTIEVACDLTYQLPEPATFLFGHAVATTADQRIERETTTIEPADAVVEELSLPGGNRLVRVQATPGALRLAYRATVTVSPSTLVDGGAREASLAELDPEVLPFLNPSRYCESDRLGKLAADEFGHIWPGLGRVAAISAWVTQRLDYVPGSTDGTTTAGDVLVQRAGVCRDYAHVSIALCRALDIPARYVSGYAVDLDPPDFHGCFEANLGGRWYLFDPTGLAPVAGFVRIATGFDAAHTAFAQFTGGAELVDKQVTARWAAAT